MAELSKDELAGLVGADAAFSVRRFLFNRIRKNICIICQDNRQVLADWALGRFPEVTLRELAERESQGADTTDMTQAINRCVEEYIERQDLSALQSLSCLEITLKDCVISELTMRKIT